MPTYVTLFRWTKQGIQNVKDTTKRYAEALKQFEAMGIKVHGFWWTSGRYDGVAITEAPNDETANAAVLATSMQGNVRTETLRAYSSEDMDRILGKLP